MCPKCKAGTMSRMGINSSNWRCNVCGYVEYRPGSAPSVSSHISANRQNRNNAANDFNTARRNAKNAMNELDRTCKDASGSNQKSGGISFLGIAAILFIIWLLFH